MASLGSLVASLELQSAAFIRDFNRAAGVVETNTRAMASSMRSVEANFTAVTRAAGALGVGLGSAELVAFTKRVINTVGGLGEMAEQMGITAESLQVYDAIALQSGVKTEQLQTSISYLTRTIGDAADGNDKAIASFERLGIRILDANKKVRSTDDIFAEAAKRIAGLEDPTAKATAAADLFGAKAGSRLLPVLEQLAKGYAENASQARAMGLVLGDDVVNSADQAADAWARLQRQAENAVAERVIKQGNEWAGILKSVKESASGALGPVRDLMSAYDRLAVRFGSAPAFFPGPKATPAQLDDGTLSGLGPGFATSKGASNPMAEADKKRALESARVISDLKLQQDSINKTKAEVLGLRLAQEMETVSTAAGTESRRKYTDAQVAAAVAIQEEIDKRDRRIAQLRSEVESNEELAAAARELAVAQAGRQIAIDNEIKGASAVREQAEAAAQATVEFNSLTRAFEVNDRQLRIVSETQRILNQDWSIGAEKARELAEANVAANDNFIKVQQTASVKASEMNQALQGVSQFAERAFDRIGGAVTDMFVRGESAALAFKNVMMGILSEIIQEMLRMLIIRPMVQAATGWLGGLFSSLGGGGAAGTGSAAAANSYGVSVGAFAEGGRPPVNEASIVGERGPELFVPDVAGTIIPNDTIHKVAASGRGGANDNGAPQFYVDMRGASVEAVKRLEDFVRSVDGSIERRAVAANREAQRRMRR